MLKFAAILLFVPLETFAASKPKNMMQDKVKMPGGSKMPKFNK